MLAYGMRGTMPKMCKNALISILAVAIVVLLLVDYPGTIRGPREAFMGSSEADKDNPYQARLDALQDYMDADSYKEQAKLANSGPAIKYLGVLRTFSLNNMKQMMLSGGSPKALAETVTGIEALDMVLGASGGSVPSTGGFSSFGSSDTKDDDSKDDSKKESNGWSPF